MGKKRGKEWGGEVRCGEEVRHGEGVGKKRGKEWGGEVRHGEER